MNHAKTILFLSFALLCVFLHPALAESPYVCEGPYALCTTASCNPIPGEPTKVLCSCKAETGYSAGYIPCKPAQTTKEGYQAIASRYYPIESYVQCSNARPWANCLDQPCIVDSKDPTKAMCTCLVVAGKGDYVLPSDTCDKSRCDSGLYSSALVTDNAELEAKLQDAVKEGKFPAAQSKVCP